LAKSPAQDRRKFTAFDWFVWAGGAVNVLVVLLLFGDWVTH